MVWLGTMLSVWVAPRDAVAGSHLLVDPSGAPSAELVAEVAAETGLAPAALPPLDLRGALAEEPPRGLGPTAAPVASCTAERRASIDDVRVHVRSASDALRARQLHEAMANARAATVASWCTGALLPRPLVAQAYAARGVATWLLGAEPLGLQDLDLALRLDPSLRVDPSWPGAAAQAFDQASTGTAEAAPSSIDVFPLPAGSALWVDGEVAARGPDGRLEVEGGLHLLQIQSNTGVEALEMLAEAGEEHDVLLPQRVRPGMSLSGWAATERGRRRLGGMLQAVLGTGEDVYVVQGDELWVHRTGTGVWSQVGEGEAELPTVDAVGTTQGSSLGTEGFEVFDLEGYEDDVEVVARDDRALALQPTPVVADRRPRRKVRTGLVATGLTLAVLGGGASGGIWLYGNQLLSECERELDTSVVPRRICPDNERPYNLMRTALPAAEAVGGAGLGLALIGLVFRKRVDEDDLLAVQPLLGADGAGVRVTLTLTRTR